MVGSMEFKYILFFLMLLIGVPLGIVACIIRPAFTKLIVCVLVWATCEPMTAGINFVSREFYRANTRGFEVTLADLCVLILLGFMQAKPQDYPLRRFPPMAIPTFLYLLVGFISWIFVGSSLSVPPEAIRVPYDQFEVGLYPLFELFKIVRGYLLFWVIANYVRSEEAARDLLRGIALTVLYMGYLTITSRYVHGIHRVQATLGHPNSLATYMAMMGSFSFAFVLYSKKWFASLFWGFLALLSTACVILTISRGGLAALMVGIWINTVVLLPRHLNLKNFVLILVSLLTAGVLLAVAMDTLAGRFVGEQDAASDMVYRGKYNDQAKLMAQEHFFGIGLGNFSAQSWVQYAGRVDPDLPPGTPAHNNWFLTLGEMGWPGVIALGFFWARYFLLLIPFYFRGKKKQKSLLTTLALASCTAIIVNQMQSLLQLGYRQTPMFSMTMIFMGIGIAAWYSKTSNKDGSAPVAASERPA